MKNYMKKCIVLSVISLMYACSTTSTSNTIAKEESPSQSSGLIESQKSSEAPSDSSPSLYILPKQSFQVDKIAEALDKLFAENDGNDNVVLYVHGRAGGKKKEPIKSLKSVMPSLRDDYTAKVIMFYWPGADEGGVKGFPEKRAREAAPALAETLLALNQYKRANSERLKNVKLTLILHSMGNIVFEEFLNAYKPGSLEKQLFDTVVLSSSASKSKDHASWLRKMDFSPHLYVTVNDDDKILISAGILRGKRLGKEIVDKVLASQATYVDVTNAHVNHAYFISSGQEDNICLEEFYEKIMNGEKFGFENTTDCRWTNTGKGNAVRYELKK